MRKTTPSARRAAEIRALIDDAEAKGLESFTIEQQQWIIDQARDSINETKTLITELRRLRFESGEDEIIGPMIEDSEANLRNQRYILDYFMREIEETTPQANTQVLVDALFRKVTKRKRKPRSPR
jgi:hypothetical protein